MPQEEQSKTKYSYLNLWKYPRETIRYYTDKPFSTFMILLLVILAMSNYYLFIYKNVFEGDVVNGMGYIVIVLYFIWLYLIGKAFKGVATYKEVFIFILLQNFVAILVYITVMILVVLFILINKNLELDNSVIFTVVGFFFFFYIFILGRISVLMYAEIEKISLKKSIFIIILVPMIALIMVAAYKIMERRAEVLSCGDTMTYSQSLRHRMTSQKQEYLLEKFTKIYAPYKVPYSLKELIKFEEKHGADSYVISFFLRPESREEFFNYAFSTDEANNSKVAKHFLPLANIDGTGATVAFWIKDINITDLENAPLIELGSEGQIDIVAKNMKDFLYMLSFGVEPMDGEYSQFIKESNGETYYRRESFKAYRRWLKNTMKIEPVSEKELKVWGTPKKIEALYKEAQLFYKKKFFTWLQEQNLNREDIDKIVKDENLYTQLAKQKKQLLEKVEKNKRAQGYLKLARIERQMYDIEKVEERESVSYFYELAYKLDHNQNIIDEWAEFLGSFSKESPVKTDEDRGYLHEQYMEIYKKLKNKELHKMHYEKALMFSKKSIDGMKDTWDIIQMYKRIATLYLDKQEEEKALEYLLTAMQHCDSDNHWYIPSLSRDIADIYENKKQYDKAIAYLKKALTIETKNPRKSIIYYRIAENYGDLKEYAKALVYAEKSLALTPNDKDSQEQVEYFDKKTSFFDSLMQRYFRE